MTRRADDASRLLTRIARICANARTLDRTLTEKDARFERIEALCASSSESTDAPRERPLRRRLRSRAEAGFVDSALLSGSSSSSGGGAESLLEEQTTPSDSDGIASSLDDGGCATPPPALHCSVCGVASHRDNFSAAQRRMAEETGEGRCLKHHGTPTLTAMALADAASSASDSEAVEEEAEEEEEEEGRVDFGAAFFGAFYRARYSELKPFHLAWVRNAVARTATAEHAPGFLRLARWVLAREPVCFGRYAERGLTYAELARARAPYTRALARKYAGVRMDDTCRSLRLFLRYVALCEPAVCDTCMHYDRGPGWVYVCAGSPDEDDQYLPCPDCAPPLQ